MDYQKAVADQLPAPRPPVVLMYHSVSPHTEDPYQVTVSPHRFEQQMRWLSARGLRGVSMATLIAARRRGSDDGLVGLTFDDGYADFLSYALPVLLGHGFSATAFVIAGRLGGDNAWDAEGPRKPLMTGSQVREVAAAGIEIGSHGLRHVTLDRTTDLALAREQQASRQMLQDLTGCRDLHQDGRAYLRYLPGRIRHALGLGDRCPDDPTRGLPARERTAVRWYSVLLALGSCGCLLVLATVTLPTDATLLLRAGRHLGPDEPVGVNLDAATVLLVLGGVQAMWISAKIRGRRRRDA